MCGPLTAGAPVCTPRRESSAPQGSAAALCPGPHPLFHKHPPPCAHPTTPDAGQEAPCPHPFPSPPRLPRSSPNTCSLPHLPHRAGPSPRDTVAHGPRRQRDARGGKENADLLRNQDTLSEDSSAGSGVHCNFWPPSQAGSGATYWPLLASSQSPQALPPQFPPLGHAVMAMPPHGGVCRAGAGRCWPDTQGCVAMWEGNGGDHGLTLYPALPHSAPPVVWQPCPTGAGEPCWEQNLGWAGCWAQAAGRPPHRTLVWPSTWNLG